MPGCGAESIELLCAKPPESGEHSAGGDDRGEEPRAPALRISASDGAFEARWRGGQCEASAAGEASARPASKQEAERDEAAWDLECTAAEGRETQ